MPFCLFSQKTKSDTIFEYKYFKNGKVSTKKAVPKGEVRFGYFKAYKIDGTEIYNMSIRNVGGHSSVDASYYPSGAISVAHYTGQPDGGIQHEEITHYFDEQGNITDIVDMSHDGFPSITVPDLSPYKRIVQEKKEEKKEEKLEQVVKCAIIYSTEIYIVNLTHSSQKIKTIKSPPNGFDFKASFEIGSGDTLKAGTYVEAQMFTAPKEIYSCEIQSKKSKKPNSIIAIWDTFVQPNAERRIYYLLLIDKNVR